MPMPSNTNDLTLGGVLASLNALTDEDCSPPVRDIFEKLVEWWQGSGCPGGKATGQEKVYAVYYRTSDGAFVGGNPQDPLTPHVLLTSAGGTIIVQDEGTPLTARGIINLIGASVTAVDNAGATRTDITITGGTSNSFETIAVAEQDSIVADSATDTLTIAAGTGIELTTNPGSDTLTITNIGPEFCFGTIAVSGQSSVLADAVNDTLTFAAGTGIAITTNAGTDTITIATTGLPTVAFSTIAVSGQSNVVADAASDTLTLVAGSNVTITTNATTDTITIAATGGGGGTYLPGLYLDISGAGSDTFDVDLTEVAGWNAGVSQAITHNASGVISWLDTTICNPAP